jgi:Mn-containing catalase
VPFNGSHVYASGNIAADMYCNVCAEATGRALAVRLYNMTDDPGMKDMLSFLIARDTMHQQQWLAVIEELGGTEKQLPIPNSFPQEQELGQFSYAFFVHNRAKEVPDGRWTNGCSLDGKGRYSAMISEPLGGEPTLKPARPDGGAQAEQSSTTPPPSAAANNSLPGGGSVA